MEKFRNLSKNIFFKIFLAFLGLTFIMWGVGDFILGDKGSWIAKVDNNKISYQKFVGALQNEREAIYRSNPKEEILQYLNSLEFKNNVLSRMITRNLVKLLQKDFGIYADENLILKQIAEDPAFKGSDGKFDRIAFKNFLNRNHLTEKQYIENIKGEIVGTIIIYPLTEMESVNQSIATDLYKYSDEKRLVDIVTISLSNIGKVKNPNDFELTDFFEKNKNDFILPQMRKVSYIEFTKNDLIPSVKVSKEEIFDYYQNNSAIYEIPQSRDFYHLLFEDEQQANNFINALEEQKAKNSNAKTSDIFAELAVEIEGKDKDSILLSDITKPELFKEIAEDVFAINKGQYSSVLQSPIGFHLFYLLDITPSSTRPLAEVRNDIKKQLLEQKQEKLLTQKLNNIEDQLLVSNSLLDVAKKFGFKISNNLAKFNVKGLDSRGNIVKEIKDLEQFVENSFSLAAKETSRLFYSKGNDKYYAIFVEEIDEERQRSLDEVRVMATDMWIKNKKYEELQKLSEEIAAKIKKQKGRINISEVKGLKIERKREFPRNYMVDIGNGRQLPHSNDFLKNIFSLNIGEVSSPYRIATDQFIVGVVRKIITPRENKDKIKKVSQNLIAEFKNDILTKFNQYIQAKFPVEVNNNLIQEDQQ